MMLRKIVEKLGPRYGMVPESDYADAVRRREDARRELVGVRAAWNAEDKRMADRLAEQRKEIDRMTIMAGSITAEELAEVRRFRLQRARERSLVLA